MIGGKTFEKISFNDFDIKIMEGKSRGHQEDARALGFLEFVEFLEGSRKKENMTSDFLTHRTASVIASSIYQSIVSQYHNKNAKIEVILK